jgi:hypothetical protein
MLANLVSSEIGLWFSAITATAAAYYCVWGAFLGIIRHRIPRILVAASVAVVAATYWLEIFDVSSATIDMRRGAGWLLWPALAWTAWSGIRYSRQIVTELEDLLDEK